VYDGLSIKEKSQEVCCTRRQCVTCDKRQ